MQTIHNIIHRARGSSSYQTPDRRNNNVGLADTPVRPSSSSSFSACSSSSRNEDINIKNSVSVVCRLRPSLSSESPADRSVVEVLNETEIRITDPTKNLVNRFDFSACYGEQSTQQDIYEGQVHALVKKVFDGVTATIFAFGCTRSGKTHTLQGTPSDPGITPRAVRTIFERMDSLKENSSFDSDSFQISISCFEIWKDKVWDLLAEGGTATTRDVGRGDLPIRETANGQIIIPNLRQVPLSSISQFDKLYGQLMRTRSVSTTKLNHASSRSHALLTVYLNYKNSQGTFIQGKCVLVDLAGSENNKKTGNEANKERMKESVEINQSLLALRKVVRSLNTGDHRIPYRDSKLTRILSDCLGGTSAALVICNVAPGASQYRDTMNTLTFGSHTRNVENKTAPQWSRSAGRPIPPPLSFYHQSDSKSTPNLSSHISPTLTVTNVATTLRTPLKMGWAIRPTPTLTPKGKSSLLPTSNKIIVSPPSNISRRSEAEITKTVRFRASYSNLFDGSIRHPKTPERPRTASELPSTVDLDKRVEEVMWKTLDQLVENRVDTLLKARLQENGFSPSASNATRDSEASSANSPGAKANHKDDEDGKLSRRIAALEQQFQHEYQQFITNCIKLFPAQIKLEQNSRTEAFVIAVH